MINSLISSCVYPTLTLVINIPVFPIHCYFKLYDTGINSELKRTKFETETFLPKLLVKHNIFSSISQIRKNRPDLVLNIEKSNYEYDCFTFRVGKRHSIKVIVGLPLSEFFKQMQIDKENIYNEFNIDVPLCDIFNHKDYEFKSHKVIRKD